MDQVQYLLGYKGAAIAAWLALAFTLERLAPATPFPAGDTLDHGPDKSAGNKPSGWRRLGRNAGLFLVNVGLSPLLVVPVSAWASAHALGWRPGWWSGGLGLAFDILILDLWIYWWHRANHELPFLWRFHEVHHLDRFLDTTSAIRFHFGEVALSAAVRAAIIILMGIPLVSVLTFEALVLIAAIFHHSNIRLPPRLERALAAIVVTPSIHWVHHHRVRRDTDSNYGTLFSFWDPLFASRSRTVRHPGMPIGVERRDEQPLPRLFIRPFRPGA